MKKILTIFATLLMLSACGAEQIDTGNRGVETSWGKIVSSEPMTEGLYFYNLIGGDIIEYECKTQSFEVKMSTYTKDMQTADLTVTINYNLQPENVVKLHKEIGTYYRTKVLEPKISNAIKDVVGQWNAAQLVSSRDKAAAQMTEILSEQVAKNYINIQSVMINNIDYSDVFENAIEAKVVATQKAEEAKNKTIQVEEEAKQTVLKAEAEAKAMKIKSDALAQNKSLVAYEAVQRWDGKLPQYMLGESMNMLMNVK
jgi:regulator of protease activity HflC (stomatin/prohibitin superfamily)